MTQRTQVYESEKGIFTKIGLWLNRSRLGDLMVTRGLVTGQQLLEALQIQKQTTLPLGQVLVARNVITQRQLSSVLRRQAVIRSLTAGLLFFSSLTASKRLRADDHLNGVPVRVALASAPARTQGLSARSALFGTSEKRSSNIQAFTKWTGLFSRLDSGSVVPAAWRSDLDTYKGLPLKSMAGRVNDLVNKTRYVPDKKNWGKGDYWASPSDFASRGGDCEDYAIAKYAALRALGVPEERLRVAIVQDTLKNIPHALLIVYTDEGTYYLDNQTKTLGAAGSAGRYRPIFSINREAWWLHTAPGATVVASVQ